MLLLPPDCGRGIRGTSDEKAGGGVSPKSGSLLFRRPGDLPEGTSPIFANGPGARPAIPAASMADSQHARFMLSALSRPGDRGQPVSVFFSWIGRFTEDAAGRESMGGYPERFVPCVAVEIGGPAGSQPLQTWPPQEIVGGLHRE